MPLSRQEQVNLHQAGTVSLPHPFPEVGTITYHPAGDEVNYDVVEVCYIVSSKRCIRWMVKADEVAAYCKNPADATNYEPSNWYLGEAARVELKNQKKGKGSISVKESSQTLLLSEAGVTAAESTQAFLMGGCAPDD